MPEAVAAMPEEMEGLSKLSKTMKAQARVLVPNEARYLVDGYYQVQEYRKALANQIRSADTPNEILAWLFGNVETLERHIKTLLKHFADGQLVGRWSQSICGIGPVISAGLLAHIEIEQAPTVGRIWRFAGLDPTVEWLGKEKAAKLVKETLGRSSGKVDAEDIARVASAINTVPEKLEARMVGKDGEPVARTIANLISAAAKRPWNAGLKTLCWKIGESFVKQQNNKADVYGKLYVQRKVQEEQRNEAGELATQAAAKLDRYQIKAKEARAVYESGKLPPGHLHARAKRWVVKLFLAHWHQVAWYGKFGRMPAKPYVLSILGHGHEIQVPNWLSIVESTGGDAKWVPTVMSPVAIQEMREMSERMDRC